MSAKRRKYYEADVARLDELVARDAVTIDTLDGVNLHLRLVFTADGSTIDFWPTTGRWKPHPLNTRDLANDGGMPSIERFLLARRAKRRGAGAS